MPNVTLTLTSIEIAILRNKRNRSWLEEMIVSKVEPPTRKIPFCDVLSGPWKLIGKTLVRYQPAEHAGLKPGRANFIIRAITATGPGSLYISDLDPYNCCSRTPNTIQIYDNGGWIEFEDD